MAEALITPWDDRIMTAMREARRHHLGYWLGVLAEHKNHAEFRVQQWPHSLEYGFTCACSGVEEEHRIRVHALKEMLPAARESLFRLFARKMNAGNKLRKRQERKALMRARALLYRHLTKEQRVSMRASRSFDIVGADGRNYTITEGSCNNVFTQWRNQKVSICVVAAKESLPYFDMMLAQKVLLETEPMTVLGIAYVQNRDTGEIYKGGRFLLDGSEPVLVATRSGVVPQVRELPNEVLDNPVEFMTEQMRGDLVMAEVVDEVEHQAQRVETRTAE